MHPLILTLGEAGLTKSSLSLRAYRNGIPDTSGIVSNCVIGDLPNGDYQILRLPDASYNETITLTGEYPPGVGLFLTYGAESRTNFVIPFREDGLTISSDFVVSLYVDGKLSLETFTSQALGSPADYRISGWEAIEGEHLLVWRRGGITFSFKWLAQRLIHTLNDAFAESSIIERFVDLWSSRTPVELIGDASFTRPTDRPYVRPIIVPLSAREFSIGPRGADRIDGVAHFDIFVPKSRPGGKASGMQLAESIKSLHRRVRVQSSILFTTPETRTQGMDDEVYYGIKAYCPYKYITQGVG